MEPAKTDLVASVVSLTKKDGSLRFKVGKRKFNRRYCTPFLHHLENVSAHRIARWRTNVRNPSLKIRAICRSRSTTQITTKRITLRVLGCSGFSECHGYFVTHLAHSTNNGCNMSPNNMELVLVCLNYIILFSQNAGNIYSLFAYYSRSYTKLASYWM